MEDDTATFNATNEFIRTGSQHFNMIFAGYSCKPLTRLMELFSLFCISLSGDVASKHCSYTATGTGLTSSVTTAEAFSVTTAEAFSASTPRYSKYLFHSGSLMRV